MPSRLVSMSGAAALLLISTAADAASITNRDTKDVKVTISEGETATDHVIHPSQVLDKVCMSGCIIRLDDGEEDEYEVEGDDIVAIEGGFLYYDGPDEPSAPGGDAMPPPATPEPVPAPPPAGTNPRL